MFDGVPELVVGAVDDVVAVAAVPVVGVGVGGDTFEATTVATGCRIG